MKKDSKKLFTGERLGYACFGCGQTYTRRRHLQAHQLDAWPGCPESINKLI